MTSTGDIGVFAYSDGTITTVAHAGTLIPGHNALVAPGMNLVIRGWRLMTRRHSEDALCSVRLAFSRGNGTEGAQSSFGKTIVAVSRRETPTLSAALLSIHQLEEKIDHEIDAEDAKCEEDCKRHSSLGPGPPYLRAH